MEKSPFIGQLDRQIKVFGRTEIQNGTGEMIPTDVLIAEPFAKMTDKSGSEDTEGKIRHLVDRSYVVRYNAQIVAQCNQLLIVDGPSKFDVYHVKEIGRKKHLEILVTNVE